MRNREKKMARNSLKNIFNLIDVAKEELPVEQAFLNDLKRSIELNDKNNAHVGSKTYKPSGMNCIRQSYYVITGAEADEHSAKSGIIGICESGTDRHERIQQAVIDMRNNDMDCGYINVADFVEQRELDYLEIVKRPDFEHGEYETKLYHKSLNMSFLCDGIIKYKNHYYILEIKTEASFKFNNRNGVDPSHYHQAVAYSLSFGIDDVLFLYECRDNCEKKAFMYHVTDEMKQELVGYIEECDSYIKSLKVPPIPENVPKKSCSYCSYKERCNKDG